MKNFGKCVPSHEKVVINGLEPDDPEAIKVNVIIYRDINGQDIVVTANNDPHPFYIAVDDRGRVMSMTHDIEQSQINGLDIIGIDHDYGVTYGQGGTVYSKIWNGTAIVDPQPEPEPVPDEVSRRQFFEHLANLKIITRTEALAAIQTGIIPPPLQAIIDNLPTDDDKFKAQMLVIGAQTFNHTHPFSETVRIAMQWTMEQKLEFWVEAHKL